MLTFVLSSLASEGVIGNTLNESSMSYPSDEKPKLDNGLPYIAPQLNPLLYRLFLIRSLSNTRSQLSHSRWLHISPHSPSSPLINPEATMGPSQPLPPMPPPMKPPPPSQFMQIAGSMEIVPHSYRTTQWPPPLPGYAMVGIPDSGGTPYPTPQNPYQNCEASDSSFYSHPSLPSTPLQQ